MAEEKKEKMVIISTHGGEDPERATFPFVVANAALAMEVEVSVILQGYSVTLAANGTLEQVAAPGLPPLKGLVDSFLSLGGKLLICTPCIKERKIDAGMMIEGAVPIAAGRVVQECLEADSTLNY